MLHLEQSSNSKTEEHGKAYAERGVCEPGPARAYNLVEVHSEAQANYGCLQEECGQLLSVEVIWVGERHTVDQPGQECQRSRNEPTGSDDKADEEDIFGVHGELSLPVQQLEPSSDLRRPNTSRQRKTSLLLSNKCICGNFVTKIYSGWKLGVNISCNKHGRLAFIRVVLKKKV